jgi:hypothetical protein
VVSALHWLMPPFSSLPDSLLNVASGHCGIILGHKGGFNNDVATDRNRPHGSGNLGLWPCSGKVMPNGMMLRKGGLLSPLMIEVSISMWRLPIGLSPADYHGLM